MYISVNIFFKQFSSKPDQNFEWAPYVSNYFSGAEANKVL